MKLCCKTWEIIPSTRIAYDQGVLEIRMPGEPHEIVNRLLAKIITVLAMELGMELGMEAIAEFKAGHCREI